MIQLDWLLIFVTGMLLVLVLSQALGLHRANRRLEDQAKQLQQLEKDLGALCADAVGLGDQVARLERRVKKLSEQQDQVDLRTSETPSYSQAIKMVRNGASVDQLIANCGLSQEEAELIHLLHGTRSNMYPGKLR